MNLLWSQFYFHEWHAIVIVKRPRIFPGILYVSSVLRFVSKKNKWKDQNNKIMTTFDLFCLLSSSYRYFFNLLVEMWRIDTKKQTQRLYIGVFCQHSFMYSQTCLRDPLHIMTSFVSRPYLFLPSAFPCIRPLYNDPLSNETNDRVLWVKILHRTTIRRLLSNRKLDNK